MTVGTTVMPRSRASDRSRTVSTRTASARWNLNHGDRGVVMMRRLISENIAALAEGRDYTTIERAEQVDGVVPTYTRDTVMRMPPRDADEDELMRSFGKALAALVFEAAKQPVATCRDYFSSGLDEFLAAYRE